MLSCCCCTNTRLLLLSNLIKVVLSKVRERIKQDKGSTHFLKCVVFITHLCKLSVTTVTRTSMEYEDHEEKKIQNP